MASIDESNFQVLADLENSSPTPKVTQLSLELFEILKKQFCALSENGVASFYFN